MTKTGRLCSYSSLEGTGETPYNHLTPYVTPYIIYDITFQGVNSLQISCNQRDSQGPQDKQGV